MTMVKTRSMKEITYEDLERRIRIGLTRRHRAVKDGY